MLTINYIKEHKEKVIHSLKVRKFKSFEILDQIIETDDKRKSIQTELDANLSEANGIAAQIKDLFKSGRGQEASALKERGSALKTMNADLKNELNTTKETLESLLSVSYTHLRAHET